MNDQDQQTQEADVYRPLLLGGHEEKRYAHQDDEEPNLE
jgi:hypothetical protein